MKGIRQTLLSVLFLFSATAFCQEVMYEDDTPILLRKEMSFGLTVHTSGYGLLFRRGVHMTGSTKRMLEVEAVGMKNPKEVKTHAYQDSKPFVYGKLNSLMLLRGGIGLQHVLYKKGDRTGLEIRMNYSVGLTIGIAKPVYLYISSKPGEKDSTAPERYDPLKHNINNIYGRAEFRYGLDELSFHPGLYAKWGFSFEFGRSDRSVRSLETGASLDMYPYKIPVMAYAKNNPYYFSLYISLLFGGKW